jgi:hypothetical protein
MTVRAARVGLACTTILALVILTQGTLRLGAVRKQTQAAQSAMGQITCDAKEVVELRGRQQRAAVREQPQQDVIAQVNAIISEVGVPSRSLRSLSPESDSQVKPAYAVSAAKLRRQSLRLVLENLSTHEIGAFLMKWRLSQRTWTVTRIELNHVRSQEGSDDRYDVTLVISALYVDDTSGSGLPRTEGNS